MALGDAGGVVRERWALLGKLRDAGWRLSLALCLIALVTALIPAASAVTMALLVGSLERRLAFGPALLPLAAFGATLLAGHVLNAAVTPLAFAIQSRVDGRHRAAVARLAASAPVLTELESQRVQDLIQVARADPWNWTERTPGSAVLSQVDIAFSYVGLVSSCAVLAYFSPHRLAMFEPVWRGRLRQCVTGPVTVLGLCGAPLAVSYALVAAGTAGGHHSVAAETAVLSAGVSVFLALSTAMPLVDVEGALPCVRALAELRTLLGEGTGRGENAGRGAAEAPAAAPPAAKTQQPLEGKAPQLVRFDKVSFSYQGNGAPVLHDLDLEIRPGELLAIVGLNGAGKSTLIKLLSGLYRPSHGSITAGGADIFADLPG